MVRKIVDCPAQNKPIGHLSMQVITTHSYSYVLL